MTFTTTVEHLPSLGNPNAPIGSEPWSRWIRTLAQRRLRDETETREGVQLCINGLLETGGWKLLTDAKGKPFRSWPLFCKTPIPDGLGYSVEAINAVLESLPPTSEPAKIITALRLRLSPEQFAELGRLFAEAAAAPSALPGNNDEASPRG